MRTLMNEKMILLNVIILSAEAVFADVLQNIGFLRPSGLHVYQKESPTQVFFCEICEIFKNTFFTGHL